MLGIRSHEVKDLVPNTSSITKDTLHFLFETIHGAIAIPGLFLEASTADKLLKGGKIGA